MRANNHSPLAQCRLLCYFIFFFTLSTLLFTGCEKNLYDEAIQQNHRKEYQTSHKTFQELNSNSIFSSAYRTTQTAIQEKSLTDRVVFGLEVDITMINEVLAENYASYSFRVMDPAESEEYL